MRAKGVGVVQGLGAGAIEIRSVGAGAEQRVTGIFDVGAGGCRCEDAAAQGRWRGKRSITRLGLGTNPRPTVCGFADRARSRRRWTSRPCVLQGDRHRQVAKCCTLKGHMTATASSPSRNHIPRILKNKTDH